MGIIRMGWSHFGENFVSEYDISLIFIPKRLGLIKTHISEISREKPRDSGMEIYEVTPTFLLGH